MLNSVILVGHVASVGSLRATPDGTPVLGLVLAVDRDHVDKSQVSNADFITIKVWDQLATNCLHHLESGMLVAVEGRLQVRTYLNPQGERRKSWQVRGEAVRFLSKPKNAPTLGAAESVAAMGEPPQQ